MNNTSRKRIALVGHCGPDTSYLMMAAQKAVPGAETVRINEESTLTTFLSAGVDDVLLLINRVLDGYFEDESGVDLIRRLRTAHGNLRMMLVSNYDDAQQSAIGAGALRGFGKRDIGTPKVLDLIRGAVGAAATSSPAPGK